MSDKRTILVTGCSDGSLGSALALALHAYGWRVFASARNASKLTATEAAGIESVIMDVCSDESVSAAVDHVKKLTGGSLDGLINNAGAAYNTPVIHIDIAKAHEVYELNVFSIVRVTQAFLPLLLKSQHGAIIANNTSGNGILGCGSAFTGAYNSSKAAASSLTEALRLELQPFGIKTINLVTGGVKSTFFKNAPDHILPADSMYNIAKEAIEGHMGGNQSEHIDSATWAKQVVKDISQKKPPHLVWRGTLSNTAKLVSVLPIGTVDSIHKKMAGIDVLEKNIKEQGGLAKVKQDLAR
jgi:NAD(P)-dependent dehydrogenase (short-subunit alcohol dehydrogenase family)